MRFHFKTVAVHAQRVADAILPVHGEAALDDVDDLAVVRDGDGAGLVEGMGRHRMHRSHCRRRPTAPRLLTDETCAPARLTSAEVISSPEVCSAFSTERVIACVAAARSTMTPLRIPSEGSMPTPRMRMDLLSSTRHQRADLGRSDVDAYNDLFHVIANPVIWAQSGYVTLMMTGCMPLCASELTSVYTLAFSTQYRVARPKVNTPAAGVIPAKPQYRVIEDRHAGRDVGARRFQRLDHVRGDERTG